MDQGYGTPAAPITKKLTDSPAIDAFALHRAVGTFFRERNRLYEALRMAILGNDAEGITAGMFELYRHSNQGNAVAEHAERLKTEDARALLERLKLLGLEYRRPLDIAEASVLLAALDWAAGARDKALTLFRDTMEVMQPYCFTRVFANEGAAILSMLRKIQADNLGWVR